MKKRIKVAVVRTRYFSKLINPENYFYGILLRDLPFRDESELLRQDDGITFGSSFEAFRAKMNLLRPLNPDYTYQQQYAWQQELHEVIEHLREFGDRMDDGYVPNDEGEDILNDQAADDARQPNDNMDDDTYNANTDTLNDCQREIVERMIAHFRRDIAYEAQLAQGQHPGEPEEPLKIHVSGGAGTGKSFFLRQAREAAKRFFKPLIGDNTVKTFAPTGCAAKVVNGTTLHSGLRLGVEIDGKIPKYKPLYGTVLKQLRLSYKNVRLIIIDEISMVSFQLFQQIEQRLREISSRPNGQNIPFGGFYMILVGDVMQLPPVQGTPIYKTPNGYRGPFHWRKFDFVELEQNMRQRNDNIFASILNKIRVGEILSTADKQKLRSRVKKPQKLDNTWSDFQVVKVFATNPPADIHNIMILDALVQRDKAESKDTKIYEFKAHDEWITKDKSTSKKKNVSDYVSKKNRSSGGLPTILRLAIGARVMLRNNKDIARGLVNGAMGTVISFRWKYFARDQLECGDLPRSICIKFDTIDDPIDMEPISLVINAVGGHGKIERTQLPFILAYGITAHKLQGMTIDRANIVLDRTVFAKGQPYVMLSRVRQLDDLIFDELDESKLDGRYVNADALVELRRLRKLPVQLIHGFRVRRPRN